MGRKADDVGFDDVVVVVAVAVVVVVVAVVVFGSI